MYSHHFIDLIVLSEEEGEDLLDELRGVDGLLCPLDHGAPYELLEGRDPVLLLPLLGLSVCCEEHLVEQLGQHLHSVLEAGGVGCIQVRMHVCIQCRRSVERSGRERGGGREREMEKGGYVGGRGGRRRRES